MRMPFTYYMSNADRRIVMVQGALLLLQIIITYTNDIPETCQAGKTRKEKMLGHDLVSQSTHIIYRVHHICNSGICHTR